MVQLLLESSMYTKNTSGLGMEIMPSFGCLEKSCQRPSTNGSELAAVNLRRELKMDVSLHGYQSNNTPASTI